MDATNPGQISTSPINATGEPTQVLLPPTPSCSAYKGTGDLEGTELTSYCTTAIELIPAVEDCLDTGGQADDCLEWATTSEEDGGAGFTGYTDEELDLMFDLGRDRIRRGEIWNAEYDWCRMSQGEEACQAAINEETLYFYP